MPKENLYYEAKRRGSSGLSWEIWKDYVKWKPKWLPVSRIEE